ncbi:hypothetical protein P3X46_025425 [Hevea brasiliensis]|uniref:PWWP domain-containing protein n=1 Tax=Hevea brasiliensis TaxID=3981 RepID=A0ABQ9L7A7_HEVBR|nr:uncharacterized protein LOC110638000 isoform X2 [Hevea brasiliensis]XP_057989440.1 uncharacterized protein LOC110638000 isoform X2 [Hevea brasiliensis]KAJ9159980.1 hypothetical protein P3X46_025425 [Hevea brasiliensis]
MGEHENKDFSGSTVLESSKKTVSDRKAGGDSEKTQVAEPDASDAQFQGQVVTKGSSAERLVTEEGGSCNGVNIKMVGVRGSDINVDGVCIRDFVDGGGQNLSEEATKSRGGSRELGLEGDVKTLGGGVGDSGSKAIMDPSVEASKLGTESEVGNSSGVAESKEEELVEDVARVREVSLELVTKVGNSFGVAESKEEGELVENVAIVREVNLGETEDGKSSGFAESKEEGELVEDATRVRDVNLGTESEIGKCSGTEESKEGVLVEGVTRVRELADVDVSCVADDNTLQEVEAGNAQNVGIESAVVVSSLVKGSTGRETQVVVEKVAVVTGKEHLEGALDECIGKVGMHVVKDVSSQEVGVSENEVHNQGVENVGGSSAVFGSSVVETQAFAVEKSELVEEAMDQAKETNDNEGASLQDSETQKVCVLHDEAWNPGIKTASAPSSIIKEGSNVETQGIEEEALVMVDDGNLNPKIETVFDGAHGSDSVEGVVSCSEKDSVAIEKDAITNAASKCLDGQIDGKFASMDNEEITYPNIEDLQSSQQPTPAVVGGEVGASENMVLLNSEDEKKLIIEECSDQIMPHDSAQFHSPINPEMGADEQVAGAEKAGIQKEQGKVETANESTENHLTKGLDFTTSHQSALAVGDELAEMDDKVHLDANFGGPIDMHLDGMLSSSGNEQHIKIEIDSMEIDSHTTSTDKDKVNSTANVSDTAGKDHELKVKECIDKSAACDPDQDDPNMGQLIDVQEQAACVEQLGREETKAIEQNSETVCASREKDTLLIDGEQTAIADNDVTLNAGTGLEGPPEGNQNLTVEEDLDESADSDVSEIESSAATETVVEEHDAFIDQVGLQEGQEMEAEEQDADSELLNTTEEKSAKEVALNSRSSVIEHQASYKVPPDVEGEFTVSDLVWGKVRSHPWWPGQIFDPSDASEKAAKYHKKDCFLVAYFGDRTFAWNEASLLKPFRSHFSQVEKQSNSETFQNAVDCALEEVSRRVEYGLACSCIPKDTYDKLKFQIVENTGIRQEASVRDGVDKSLVADLFEPGKLVEYMKALAQCPAGGADRLELVIARSQLLAFYRLKGYSQLPEFQFCGGLLENAGTLEFTDEVIEPTYPFCKDDGKISSGQEIVHAQRSSYHKRKHNLKDTVYPRKKERSLSELMGDSWECVDDEIGPDGKANNKLVSPSSGKKRKVFDSFPDDLATAEGRKTLSLAKVSTSAPSFPKPSFKIGECIRRVASQMTGSTCILKSNNMKQDGSSDGLVGDGSDVLFEHSEDAEMRRAIVPTEYSSLDELLSQLHLVARDPFKGYSFLSIIISFFSDFRNSVIMEQHEKVGCKRRQASHSIFCSPETFEFEDMNDTYWTDRVIQNGSEEQPPRKSRKRDNQLVSMDQDKALNKSNSRKRYSDGNYGLSAEKPVSYVDENAPAELVMHFPVVDCVPSEISLNKMFRRFGPLKESETEVDKDTNRARVVFKKCSDAEAAYGSAPKFNIFGSVLVNYQLNYTISVPFKSQPMNALQGEEDATLFLQY